MSSSMTPCLELIRLGFGHELKAYYSYTGDQMSAGLEPHELIDNHSYTGEQIIAGLDPHELKGAHPGSWLGGDIISDGEPQGNQDLRMQLT